MGRADNETYGDYSVDSEDQPSGEGDSLVDNRGLTDPLEEGYSPPDAWSAAQRYGNTPLEAELGEGLNRRLRQEEPDPDPYAEQESWVDEDGVEPEVGERRAGRLVDPDAGVGEDTTSTMVGRDVGIDGAGASAEEAAMHILDDESDWQRD